MAPSWPVEPPSVKSLGFWASEVRPQPSEFHAHTDIEGSLLLDGSITCLHGGRSCTIRPGQLMLFWAGIPHRIAAVEGQARIILLVVPLAWYMQWQLPEMMTQLLLGGRVLMGTILPGDREIDDLVMRRWARELDEPHPAPEVRRIAELEVEARFRRLARAVNQAGPQHPSSDDASGSHAELLASFMAQHYQDELSVARIAQATDLHPNYAMQLFKARCGMGMWEYLTRLRISHAQRLLLTTDWKIHHIAVESGFCTPSRFYSAFVRISQCTPKAYRSRARAVASAQ